MKVSATHLALRQAQGATHIGKQMMYDTARIRADFPILNERVNGKPVVFLDSAASSQKPEAVIRAMDESYRHAYANVHRGVYAFSEAATAQYDEARAKIAGFINAPAPENVVFTRNDTEALNLIAYSYGRTFLKEGDEVVTEGSYALKSEALRGQMSMGGPL